MNDFYDAHDQKVEKQVHNKSAIPEQFYQHYVRVHMYALVMYLLDIPDARS